jgi:hypothetical protein
MFFTLNETEHYLKHDKVLDVLIYSYLTFVFILLAVIIIMTHSTDKFFHQLVFTHAIYISRIDYKFAS